MIDGLCGLLMDVQFMTHTPQHHNLSNSAYAAAAPLNCPSPDETKRLLPTYGLENAVAEFNSYARMMLHVPVPKGPFMESIIIYADTGFLIRAYDSGKMSTNRQRLRTRQRISEFLKEDGFDIVEIYEMDEKHRLSTRPSAILYRNKGITYLLIEIEGLGEPEDNFRSVDCVGKWSEELVKEAGNIILLKRAGSAMKGKDFQLPPPENRNL